MVTQRFAAILWNEEITAVLHRAGKDCAVVVVGGQKEHVGAVSLCSEEGETQTLVFPGHKEQFITGPWCESIHALTGGAVSVAAGVHYDDLSKEEIAQVMYVTDALLGQVLRYLAADRSA